MPKVSIDYSNTCIYKLVHIDDLNDENIYVGHTTNIVQRKYKHKSSCGNPNNKEYNLKVYQFIRENGGWDQWNMILIEKYPCNDVYEAIARERYWKRELNSTLNTQEPGRTIKEYNEENKEKIHERNNQYYKGNKDKILKERKQYRENNHDKMLEQYKTNYNKHRGQILEKKSEKITCECGSIVRSGEIARHRKSKKHQEWLKNNNLIN